MTINTETIAEVLENFPNASGFKTNLLYANPKIPIEHKIAQGAPKKRKYECLIESLKIGNPKAIPKWLIVINPKKINPYITRA